ncbi:hypothetical protein ACJIZ3_010146 [Penstemon smallii]|uniref:Uncharacterized protein n=1 Tax=Penstemon smallii TaxID=265156 RepID=A0ABD3TFE4_9LAMI
MNGYPLPKRPKIEREDEEEQQEPVVQENEEDQIRNEQDEALVALVDHRIKEVDHLRHRISYYKSQLVEAEKKLEDTQNKLARHRQWDPVMTSRTDKYGMSEVNAGRSSASPTQMREGSSQNNSQYMPQHPGHDSVNSAGENLKFARRPPSPFNKDGASSRNQTQSRPQPLNPAVEPYIPQPVKLEYFGNNFSSGSGSVLTGPAPSQVNSLTKFQGDKARRIPPDKEAMETQDRGTKRKIEQKEHKDVIQLISKRPSPSLIKFQNSCFLPCHHKRKLRSLVLCPTNDQLFVTSALDGVVNLWQVQGRGSSANLLSATDCQSDKQKRWPEDIAWHPQGNKLFSVYSQDGGDSQVSILNLNKGKEKTRIKFLEDKPHARGIINSIIFTPWDDACFVTGGSDHAVILWNEKDGGDDSWRPKALHRSHHSSAVMGVAGMLHKKVVMSVGADKRIIGFDVVTGRADYKHQIENKCMSVLPNPCDFNLFMVQTG